MTFRVMKEFEVLITETLQRKIKVQASDFKDAQNKVRELYLREEIVLSADDFVDYRIEANLL